MPWAMQTLSKKILEPQYKQITSNSSLSEKKEEQEKIRLILNEINPSACESVPDPYYGVGNGFQIVYDMLDKACDKIVSSIE